MAFGIDDALSAAAAGLNLTDTIAQTVQDYRKKKKPADLELLLEQVRLTALERLDAADVALTKFERMLKDKGISTDNHLTDVIAETPFWKPWEQHNLSQIQKAFNCLWDSIYAASDDVAALVRCREDTGVMGMAVVESAKRKHQFNKKLLESPSLKKSLSLLRDKLMELKTALLN